MTFSPSPPTLLQSAVANADADAAAADAADAAASAAADAAAAALSGSRGAAPAAAAPASSSSLAAAATGDVERGNAPRAPAYGSSSDEDDEDDGGDGGRPRGACARFKAAVKALKHEVLALHYAVQDSRTPLAAKVLPWVALAYALSPLDLIPDFIPVLGLVDDLLLLPALLWLALRFIPAGVMADARNRARTEPLLLHRNWGMAVAVFALWAGAAMATAWWAFDRWFADDDTRPYGWAVAAGTGGACAVAFVVWMVSRLQHERRRRDEWNAALNAALLPGGGGGSGG